VTSKWSLCKIAKVWNLTTSVAGHSRTKFLAAPLFKNTNQSWMQTSRRWVFAFLTCNRASCLTHDVTHHHHRRVSSWVLWLRSLCFAPLRHYRNSPSRFSFFTALFSWVINKNLRHDHCSSICNALMMIRVIETFAICRWFRVARSLQIFSRTFSHFVVIDILLHAYFEYFLDIAVAQLFVNS